MARSENFLSLFSSIQSAAPVLSRWGTRPIYPLRKVILFKFHVQPHSIQKFWMDQFAKREILK